MKHSALKLFIEFLIVITIYFIAYSIFNHFEYDFKWYYRIGVIIIGFILSRFIYAVIWGINISEIRYINNSMNISDLTAYDYLKDVLKVNLSENDLFFAVDYQLGFRKKETIYGVFKNELNLSESDLQTIIYSQTNRRMLLNEDNAGIYNTIEYNHMGNKFEIHFIR